ncbi:DUF1995 family protein [Cyanobacterium sp. IPPAS B-1200]|uniref:DUF1995 family protein n=1 Tax=Cyanobacterium sp. IPPAS B-1200 TaxID=1562720 RepID=UPI0008527E92|nr:DUF1995 family protein [Cyanobacterium sp. IPPAS B-1200]OEJ78261.1 hypothetical protein A5482_03215 [Cyanobacterium sp. IPPAS B-1200]
MTQIPQSLESAIAQAHTATLTALESGFNRLQVELIIPEIALKGQELAFAFAQLFSDYGAGLKVFFPDTGAAALAKREWGETAFQVSDLGSSRSPVENKVSDTDEFYLVISPSAVEVAQVEKLCNLAGDRPVILIIPQLEDISVVGIGYAARQLRERFLSTLESSYYYRPLDEAVVIRTFPGLWQVWRELEGNQFELITEVPQKPLGEALDRILMGNQEEEETSVKSASLGLFATMKNFLKALNN